MGDTDDAKDAIKARKELYLNYLKEVKNKEDLFQKIFNSFLEKYKDENYIYDLENNPTIATEFKESIVSSHFEWLEKRILNQNKTIWGITYSLKAKKVIKELTKRPYCHFYMEFKNSIVEELELRPRAKKILKKRCDEILEIYACTKDTSL